VFVSWLKKLFLGMWKLQTIDFYVCYKVRKLNAGKQYSKEKKNNFHFPMILIPWKWVRINDSNEYSNKIEITTHIPPLTNNSKEHNYNLWSTDTDTDTGHDTDTNTATPIIIWKNDIIQGNHKCRVGVWHGHVSDTDTPNLTSVRAL
jgi:hypothetical protein